MCWITFLSTKTLVISQKSFRLSEAVNGFQTDISANRVAIRSNFSVLMLLHFCKEMMCLLYLSKPFFNLNSRKPFSSTVIFAFSGSLLSVHARYYCTFSVLFLVFFSLLAIFCKFNLGIIFTTKFLCIRALIT